MKVLKKDTLLFLLFLSLSLLILFLDINRRLSSPKTFFLKLVSPVSNGLYVWKGAGLYQYLPYLQESQRQIEALEQENNFLVSQISQFKEVEEENVQMKRLLGTNISPSWKFSIASVINGQADILNILSEGKLEEGQFAILPRVEEATGPERLIGVYVGKVRSTGNFVHLELPTNPQSKLEVVVRSQETFEKQASGILEGRGGGMLITQVLSSENLNKGDWVLVNTKGDLRSELLVGRIVNQVDLENLGFKKAEVEMVIDKSKLSKIFIVKK